MDNTHSVPGLSFEAIVKSVKQSSPKEKLMLNKVYGMKALTLLEHRHLCWKESKRKPGKIN